nr:ABC transporter permease [Variovorax boronicumulans]
MNPHAASSISLFGLCRSLYTYRLLLVSLAHREVVGRYRGSLLGMMWSFFNPVLMLAVYTFVFSVVFKTRWAGGTGSRTEFALVLFAGLIFFNLFAECITRAPGLILGNATYVKKVVFPLELLVVVPVLSALFHAAVSFVVWLLFYLVLFGIPPVTILLTPLVMLPLLLIILGLSWFLSALGVYVRDVTQMISLVVTVLMFMSPIFYAVSALPAEYQAFMHLNPLTFVVEQSRDLMIFGRPMRWFNWFVQVGEGLLLAIGGYAWFQKTRKGFADVL